MGCQFLGRGARASCLGGTEWKPLQLFHRFHSTASLSSTGRIALGVHKAAQTPHQRGVEAHRQQKALFQHPSAFACSAHLCELRIGHDLLRQRALALLLGQARCSQWGGLLGSCHDGAIGAVAERADKTHEAPAARASTAQPARAGCSTLQMCFRFASQYMLCAGKAGASTMLPT